MLLLIILHNRSGNRDAQQEPQPQPERCYVQAPHGKRQLEQFPACSELRHWAELSACGSNIQQRIWQASAQGSALQGRLTCSGDQTSRHRLLHSKVRGHDQCCTPQELIQRRRASPLTKSCLTRSVLLVLPQCLQGMAAGSPRLAGTQPGSLWYREWYRQQTIASLHAVRHAGCLTFNRP